MQVKKSLCFIQIVSLGKNIASLPSAESAHSMVSVKVKVFNDSEQTPDDCFHQEFWYFALNISP